MADQPVIKRKTAAIIVFVAVQLFILGLLWVVFSGSGDREGRIKAAIAIANAEKLQDAIASYYEERNTLPADNNALRLQNKQAKPYFTAFEEHDTPSYTINVANGVIILTFSANQESVSSKTLIFVPQISNGKLEWNCDTGSLEAIYRPPQCGGKQP